MKHLQDETIAAIATPIGQGGVGVIRVSGVLAWQILNKVIRISGNQEIRSQQMLHGFIIDPGTSQHIDKVMACFMQAPRSYTGEDVVEIYCHGSVAVLQQVLELAISQGARLAGRGEFTKRAFINRKLDLAQAEAVLDLVKAPTAKGAGYALQQLEGRLSRSIRELRDGLLKVQAELESHLDFSDDLPELNYDQLQGELNSIVGKIELLLTSALSGKVYRAGLATAIIGKPNVGKSSLLNALLKEERAIVTEVPGTTRDAIEEIIDINGFPLRIIDTAGLRHTKDRVEGSGIERAEKELAAADFALIVLDRAQALDELDELVLEKAKDKPGVIVLNKSDLPKVMNTKGLTRPMVEISCLRGEGISDLSRIIIRELQKLLGQAPSSSVIINARHKECLTRAQESLARAIESVKQELSVEFVAVDLKEAIVALGEVTGEIVSDEVINAIFEQFCVGK